MPVPCYLIRNRGGWWDLVPPAAFLHVCFSAEVLCWYRIISWQCFFHRYWQDKDLCVAVVKEIGGKWTLPFYFALETCHKPCRSGTEAPPKAGYQSIELRACNIHVNLLTKGCIVLLEKGVRDFVQSFGDAQKVVKDLAAFQTSPAECTIWATPHPRPIWGRQRLLSLWRLQGSL